MHFRFQFHAETLVDSLLDQRHHGNYVRSRGPAHTAWIDQKVGMGQADFDAADALALTFAETVRSAAQRFREPVIETEYSILG